VALVNNAGRAHIEFLGSEDAVARAKGEIFEGLRPDGTAVINADDRYSALWRELAAGKRQIEFGLEQPAQVTATYALRALESEIVVKTPAGLAAATVRAPGMHNVRNALAAAAAAVALEVPASAIAAGLARYSGIKGRLEPKSALKGARLIDDTYNASPESVIAAIDVLAKAGGRTLLVFGDMGELGADAPQLHAEVGAYARKAGIDRVLTLGEHSAQAAAAFGQGASHHTRIEDLLAEIENLLAPDVTVLVKGSRFMQMERVVRAFALDEKREERGVRSEEGKA
jgi:UDP-N-acetylmuramoyl-tripeptide--D-alanyl-D-alanine ligase